jgi:hypothetical protein
MYRRFGEAWPTTRVVFLCGLADSRILISATHTHTAPAARDRREVQADPQYVERLTDGIAAAVQRAHRNLEPAEIGWGVIQVPEEVFNRRWYMKEGASCRIPLDRPTTRYG